MDLLQLPQMRTTKISKGQEHPFYEERLKDLGSVCKKEGEGPGPVVTEQGLTVLY